MKIIEMKKYRKIKIGFESKQNLLIKNYKKFEAKINANSIYINEKRDIIIELALARHASSYGLLGATFMPSEYEQSTLTFEVRFNNDKTPYKDNISNDKDFVYLGLEEEYAKSILSSATEYFHDEKVPPGKIIFDVAAQCDVGSSIKIFLCITKILLEILLKEYEKISDEEVKYICDTYID